MMGKLFARRDDYEGEAREYRAFLMYAPVGHPDRWWVKQILEEHDWEEDMGRERLALRALRALRVDAGSRGR
jgi:hypothetical protein